MLDVLMIGHFAKDRLIYRGTTEIASGGGIYYGSMALRRLGYSVGVVTKMHPDDFGMLDELRGEGIEVHASAASATTGIENTYPTDDMDRRICRPLGSAGAFSEEEIPHLDAGVTIITPLMAGEMPPELVRAVASRGPTGIDVQGFIRVPEGETLVTREWPTIRQDLEGVAFLKTDDAEAEMLTGLADRERAGRALAGLGPREVVLTHARGVMVFAEGGVFEAPFVPRGVTGRTGRGDTCFSTYLAGRLSLGPGEACRLAAAVTSLKVERPGPYRGTREEAERLAATFV